MVDNDTYDDNYDYLYETVFRPNTKQDPGASKIKKIKRIPYYDITIESQIPDEPQEKHDKPNDSHYEKEIKKIEEEIEKHKEEKKKINDQIREEKIGKNPERRKNYDDIKSLAEQIKPLDDDIKNLNEKLREPLKEQKLLKEQRNALESELDIKDYDRLISEIQSIKQKLGYSSSLKVTEEKKLVEKKCKLEPQVSKAKKYKEIRSKLKDLHGQNESAFNELKEKNKKRGELIHKKKLISEKIGDLKKNKEENQPVITQLEKQKESISNAIKDLIEKKKEVNYEWNEKWHKFEIYMDEMEYIKEAKKKQNDLKKKEDKKKKKEEKDAEKTGGGNVEINIIITSETKETNNCKTLLHYFNSLLPKDMSKEEQDGKKDEEKSHSTKIDEDIKKGIIKPIDHNAIESNQILGVSDSGTGGGKKKGKKQKISKREQKEMQSQLLVLDIEILNKIKALGLKVPNYKAEIGNFVKTLEKKLESLRELESKEKVEESKKEEVVVNEKKEDHVEIPKEGEQHGEIPKEGEQQHGEAPKEGEQHGENHGATEGQ